jgi:isopropylmalate/homocitrate/citramalate synthase
MAFFERITPMEIRDITRALARNTPVYWSNDGYLVHWSGDTLVATFQHNGFTCALTNSELAQCYVK